MVMPASGPSFSPAASATAHLVLLLLAGAVSSDNGMRSCLALSSVPAPVAPPPPAGHEYRIAVIGGGTAGTFAAASIFEALRDGRGEGGEEGGGGPSDALDRVEVTVYDSTGHVLRNLRKHRREGILYDTSLKPRELINAGYPRGGREVTSLLTKRFPPLVQRKWFEDRGAEFETRWDGTMVCVEDCEDGSHGVGDRACDAILKGCERAVVETNAKVTSVSICDAKLGGFRLTIQRGGSYVREERDCDCVVLATGNSMLGHQLARSLGHAIAAPVRSCFAFRLSAAPALSELEEGKRHSLPRARLTFKAAVEGQKRPRAFRSEAPVELEAVYSDDGAEIVLGGRAALALSSAAPHELRDANYKGILLAHLCPDHFSGKVEKLEEHLWQHRQDNPTEVVGNRCPLYHKYVDYDDYDWETDSFRTVETECAPPDLWRGLTQQCGASNGSTWSRMSRKKVRKLAETMVGCAFEIVGRDDGGGAARAAPFINAGGVLLSEIDMSTMESRVARGLFCCGQVLDGDASHATFSHMRDLATARAAGGGAASLALESLEGITAEV